MEKLRERISCPNANVIISPSGYIVPKFPFLPQILDLLSTPWFQKPECCTVNADPSIRFHQYIPTEEEGYSEIAGAHWSRKTYAEKIGNNQTFLDPETGIIYQQWQLGLVMYNDKTGVGAIDGKYSLEPFMFTLSVLKREFRENADAWRHLGFIPQYNAGVNRDDEDERDAEARLNTFMEILSILLEDIVELQRNPPLLRLFLFGEWVHVRLIIEVAFVIGDQLSQDQHCARKKVNGGGAGRAHRCCMTSYQNAGKVENECQPLNKDIVDRLTEAVHQGEDATTRTAIVLASYPEPVAALPPRHPLRTETRNRRTSFHSFLKIRAITAREILEKSYGLYPVVNAWTKLSFGSNANGIYTAALDDPMHYDSAGQFMYLAHISFDGLLPSECKTIEKYLREDTDSRCSVRYDFPRGKFTVGFTNCTLLTASEKVGLMYALYFSLGTQRVSDVFQIAILRQQNKYLDTDFCCQIIGQSGKPKPDESQLPTVFDKYYFADRRREATAERTKSTNTAQYRLPRNLLGIRKIVDHLDGLGLMFVVDPKSPFDQLQTEYLLQTVWFRSGRKGTPHKLDDSAIIPSSYPHHVSTNEDKSMVVDLLNKAMRRGEPALTYPSSKSKTSEVASPPVGLNRVEKHIVKHWIDKPKQNGRGETTAILTDVPGFRRVLEHALIFHAIVHEFHELDASIQKDTSNLEEKIRDIMQVVLDGIYRGDNLVDTNTGKIHLHFHLARAT